jgi:hypothetical protein
MYGVPANLDLSSFKDATLIQLVVSEFQIQFKFHPEGSISVECKWELRDSSGLLIDYGGRGSIAKREALRLHVILGEKVQGHSVNAPDSFSLRFESGHVLTVFDDSKQYESFSIGSLYV